MPTFASALSGDQHILAALLSETEIVPGRLSFFGVTRDPKDDPVVACAVEPPTSGLV